MAKVSLKVGSISLQSGTERTFRVTWHAEGSQAHHIDKFEYIWLYKPKKSSMWIEQSTGSTDGVVAKSAKEASAVYKEVTFDAPENADQICFKVRATPKSHTVTVKKKDSKGKVIKNKKTGKPETKKVTKKYFSTTKYVSAKTATVSKSVFKGKFVIGEEYSYTPGAQYPLSITVTPYKGGTANDYSWCESFEVSWEFFVKTGSQKTWQTGEATTGLHGDQTTVYYTGTIPNQFEQLRVVTKPTSLSSNVIAENEDHTWAPKTGFSKKARSASGISIFRYPHGDNTVMAEWNLSPTAALEGFTCKFEALTEGNTVADSKRWGHAETMDIDPDQSRIESISKTIKTKAKNYVPTKSELFAEKVIQKGYDKAISYLIQTGVCRNKVEANAYYLSCSKQVDTLQLKQQQYYVPASSKTKTTKTKYWYSNEYTIPENATEIRVTITPKSAETSGYLEKPSSATYKIVANSKSVPESSITFSRKAGTRNTILAKWKKLNDNNIDSYEYKWSYKIAGDTKTYFSDGDTGTISQDAKTLYAEYEAGDNVKTLYFSVRPVPKHANDFVGKWCSDVAYSIPGLPTKSIAYSSLNVVWPQEGRTDKTLTASWSLTGWSAADRAKLAGYEITWRYKIYIKELRLTAIQEGETQTINDPAVLTKSYTPPENAKSAEFRIRPIPIGEADFEGVWSAYKAFNFVIPTRTINAGSLNIEYIGGTDRKLKVSFVMGDMSNVAGYTYKLQSAANGILSEPTETDITQNPFSIDAPADADEVYINVKPRDTSGNDMFFFGQYLGGDDGATKFNLIPDSREVDDIELFLQRGSKSTVVAVWEMDNDGDVDSYSYKWRYRIDNIWFDGTTGTTSAETLACTYDAPASADAVEVKVTPVAKYALAFTGKESEYSVFVLPSSSIPETPAVPTVSIDKFTLTLMVDSYDEKASFIEYEIINDIDAEDTETGQADILFNRATYVTEVEAGFGYRARARAGNDDGEFSDWSEYTTDPVYTIPLPPEGVPEVNALSATSVEIYWNEVQGATSYVIQRTTKSRYFDAAPDLVDETTITVGTRAEIQGLEPKSEADGVDGQWFFRIKAVNDNSGESEWSEIASIVLGTIPEPPTTWSSSKTPLTSDDVYLNWLHNCEDGSPQSGAILEMTINGEKETYEFVSEYEMFEPYIYETTVVIEDGVESAIDLSEIPSGLRSLDYGGISKLGAEGEHTEQITSTRIDGSTLYFTLTSTEGIADTEIPVTLSFYDEGQIIREPSVVTRSAVTRTVNGSASTVGSTHVSIDISDIPIGQRYDLTATMFYDSNPSVIYELKNENEVTWSATETRNGLAKGTTVTFTVSDYAIPDGLRDTDHCVLNVTDSSGNDLADYIASWDFTNSYTVAVNISNYDGEAITGTVTYTITAYGYSDNYEIDGDSFVHYEYALNSEDAASAEYYTLTISYENVQHISRNSNFNFTTGGVSYYLIPAGTYDAGAVITWKVKTRGVLPDYGAWSVERQVNIYTPPTVRVDIGSGYRWLEEGFVFRDDNIYPADAIQATAIDGSLETFPMILSIHSGPVTQKPLVYVLSLISNDTYEDIDDEGRIMHVRSGQELYKRYIYTNERDFVTLIMANELNLDNTRSYSLITTVNTDVGLSAETTNVFEVEWDMDADVELDTTLIIDEDTAVAYLSPSCTNEEGYFLNNMELSVYRRDFDGGLTTIATGIENGLGITITDPHPALDYARYRIVATDLATGRMFYEDLAPQEVGITDIIIQWDESWTGFEGDDFPQLFEEQPYKGSILHLPYNIDESESNDLDVELVNYIGRKHPVSYFGTHVGQTASWKTDVDKTDKDTIYALRRLAIWPGDCYVRSPSGVGYWAHVKVNFDITHLEPIIPVSLEITRVEGGV